MQWNLLNHLTTATTAGRSVVIEMARGLVGYQLQYCVCIQVCVCVCYMWTGDGADNWAEDSYVILPLGGGEHWEQQPTLKKNLFVNKLQVREDR